MSDVRAYRAHDIPAVPPIARAKAIWQRAARDVAVEIVDAARFAELRPAWNDLVGRADTANVFMDPAVVAVAAEVAPQTPHLTVLVWKSIGGKRRLAASWSFAVARPRHSPLPLRVLQAPAYDHCYLATPVVDRSCLDECLEAMLDAIADDPSLPKIVTLDMMDAEGATYDALLRVLGQRGSAPWTFAHTQRPKLASDLAGPAYLERALSSSSRKKLRQHRRKLGEQGTLNTVIATQPGAVCRALEEFLAIEAAGWKGRQGTALLSSKADAAFMRGAVGALADVGCAAVHSLYVGNKPASMQIVVRAGDAAFTWKTTYDETLQDFSPGMLLFESYTTSFLADDSIASVDSCAFDASGHMAAWTERRAIADLWFDVRRGRSLAFEGVGSAQWAYLGVRGLVKRCYLGWQRRRKGRTR